jgi:deoxyribodipyrimidine photolyase
MLGNLNPRMAPTTGAGSNTSLAAIAAPAIVSSKGKRSSCLSSSSFPDFLRLPEKARGFGNPSNGAASRRASIVWFRNDLRCHDNESLATASEESLSILPVYVFDPRHYEKRFDRMMGGASRASFLIQCVSDLRESLKAIGSNLIVRVGKTEEVLVSLAKAIGADGLYAHQEVSGSDVEEEKKVACALESEGVDVKYFWGNTLFHVDDLPFKVKDTPNTYTAFCESVGKVSIRKAIEAPEQLKGLPIRGNVEPGEIPSLAELGVKSSSSSSQKKVFMY